jgi:hypothetical protein
MATANPGRISEGSFPDRRRGRADLASAIAPNAGEIGAGAPPKRQPNAFRKPDMNFDKAVNVEDFRRLAKRRLPKMAFDFIEGGCDDEFGAERE